MEINRHEHYCLYCALSRSQIGLQLAFLLKVDLLDPAFSTPPSTWSMLLKTHADSLYNLEVIRCLPFDVNARLSSLRPWLAAWPSGALQCHGAAGQSCRLAKSQKSSRGLQDTGLSRIYNGSSVDAFQRCVGTRASPAAADGSKIQFLLALQTPPGVHRALAIRLTAPGLSAGNQLRHRGFEWGRGCVLKEQLTPHLLWGAIMLYIKLSPSRGCHWTPGEDTWLPSQNRSLLQQLQIAERAACFGVQSCDPTLSGAVASLMFKQNLRLFAIGSTCACLM